MKLRNKKTRKIVCARFCGVTYVDDDDHLLKMWLRDGGNEYEYNTLAELNEEWEDYEEPEVYYFISDFGAICKREIGKFPEDEEDRKKIGNYFEILEEAKKAVEKLKAWKRLKDKGFEIEDWDNTIGDDYYKTGQIVLNLNNVNNRDWNEYSQISEIKNDLYLLFGGEE